MTRTRPSIGVKLALRYALTLLAVLALFAAGVSSLVTRRINREALLVLDVQLSDLAESYREHRETSTDEDLLAWFDEHARSTVAGAEQSIGLGVELLDEEGARLVAHGSLSPARPPLDRRLLDGARDEVVQAVNLGGEFAFLCRSQRVQGGFLRVAVDTARFARNAAEIRRIFLWSVPGVACVAVLAGWWLARGALRPLAEINAAARHIRGDVEGTIPVTGTGDEIDQLAATLNEMIERIRTGIARLRRFSENAAHELRSPLNRMRHQIDRLQADATLSPEGHAALDALGEEISGMAREIEAMLRLARIEEGLSAEQRAPVSVAAVIEHVESFFEAEAEAAGVALEAHSDPELRVLGDREWIQTAISNLVSNAIKFADGRGRVVVDARRNGGDARIEVRDEGPGISGESMDEIFERFGRSETERHRPGFGLGLPIAREIARAHGGRITAEPRAGGGTVFILTLPVLA